jgi:very-short-patch-repair endonuclease
MDAVAALRHLGGVGTAGQIVRLSSRRRLRASIRAGAVIRVARARYALSDTLHHRKAAARLSGVTSHLSAAQHWGWEVKEPPARPWVTVPRNRQVAAAARATTEIVYADLGDDEVVDGVTSKLRTVMDCARRLPFNEALAVADSALRAGDVAHGDLAAAAAMARGNGATQVRQVAREADARAANPFESVLRAIVLEFPQLEVVPQAPVPTSGLTYHPDLVDEGHRLVLEAESWSWHADQQTHSRDCVRFTLLSVAGWTVLRFTWPQVMHSPSYVRAVLAEYRPTGSSPTKAAC